MVAAAHRRATEARERAPHRAVVGTGQDAQSHNELLKCLQADDLRAFRNVARPAPLLRGAVLHRSGDPLQWIHFIEEGLVSLHSQLEDGRDMEPQQWVLKGRSGSWRRWAAAWPVCKLT